MKINEVKITKNLFFKPEVVIVTDDGKINIKENWDESLIKKLDKNLRNFKLEGSDDFDKFREKLKWLDEEKYSSLERAMFNSFSKRWGFFNPDIKQIPRPMNIVIKKNIGIREYVVFSLNARDFEAALIANRHVVDFLNKISKNFDSMKEEDVLMLIKEAIDEEHDLVEFELRIGVVFDNFENGKYGYADRELNTNQQIEFVSKLIEKYDVCYVENPFKENDFDSYKKLEKYRSKCLVCINSKINEYTKGIDENAFNTLVAKFKDISSFNSDISLFKEKGLNLVVEGGKNFVDIIVGLRVPLIKLSEDKESNEITKRLIVISDEIRIEAEKN